MKIKERNNYMDNSVIPSNGIGKNILRTTAYKILKSHEIKSLIRSNLPNIVSQPNFEKNGFAL